MAAALLSVSSADAAQRAPSVNELVSRLGAYLDRYVDTLAALVAEEHYTQLLTRAGVNEPLERVLLSDYALARAQGGHAWTGVRDTFEVDGQPVRDREQRLLALLADGSPDAARDALRISRDNARFNLGEDVISRTINVPTVALDLLHARNRERFTFSRRGDEVVGGVAAVVLAFTERRQSTILRTPDGRDRRSRGAVWLDPASGAVLRTDLSWDGAPEGRIVVHYRRDAALDAFVPDVMLEEYRGVKGVLTGKATYTNYRRFQTDARIVPNAR